MKTLNTLIKILTALAAVAGAIYIVATYGEQIVAWAKRMLASLPKCPCCETDASEQDWEEAPVEAPVEEAPAAQAEAAEEVAPEAPAAQEPTPEVAVAEHEPVAADSDFAE